MSTSRIIHRAQVVWRTERIIAELQLKRLLGNLGLQALAALVLTFALLAFEFAGYFVLVQRWSGGELAAVLGLCNLLIALLLALVAVRRSASRELALAKEVHQDALTALTAELEQAQTMAPASLRGALESAAIPLLLPLIPLMIKRLRKRTGETLRLKRNEFPAGDTNEPPSLCTPSQYVAASCISLHSPGTRARSRSS